MGARRSSRSLAKGSESNADVIRKVTSGLQQDAKLTAVELSADSAIR